MEYVLQYNYSRYRRYREDHEDRYFIHSSVFLHVHVLVYWLYYIFHFKFHTKFNRTQNQVLTSPCFIKLSLRRHIRMSKKKTTLWLNKPKTKKRPRAETTRSTEGTPFKPQQKRLHLCSNVAHGHTHSSSVLELLEVLVPRYSQHSLGKIRIGRWLKNLMSWIVASRLIWTHQF